MLEYSVLDIAELIYHYNIPVDEIEAVTAAWGDGDQYGVCLTTRDEYLFIIYRPNSAFIYNTFLLKSKDKPFEANEKTIGLDEWVDDPTDIAQWLEAGGLLEDAHEF